MNESKPQRLLALDAFRGATIAAMILVNNPGSWGAIYPPLRHASWHGWTPTDLVFPFFLWIVGVAIALALGRRVEDGAPKRPLLGKIVKRTAALLLLGLFLNALGGLLPALFGFGSHSVGDAFGTLRLPGVLQRIGVCYAVVASCYLLLPRRLLVPLCIVLLGGYHWLITQVEIPGVGAPDLDQRSATLVSWVDRQVLGPGHMWRGGGGQDPEGLLSTIPAIGSCLLGLFAGWLVRGKQELSQRVLQLFVLGSLLVLAGYVWGWFLPINKALWTSSYAVFTAGQASVALALCLYFCDLRGWRRWAQPLRIYGVNPITVFVGSGVVARILRWIELGPKPLPSGGEVMVTAQNWLYYDVYAAVLGAGELASLCYALTWVFCWLIVLWAMDRRGIHLKV